MGALGRDEVIMSRTMEFDGKTYRLYAIFNQKSHATILAKVNRVNGFSVRITEQDVWKKLSCMGKTKETGICN